MNTEDQALLNQVLDFYHETLLQSPEALEYLDKRGLGDQQLIKQFKLGYANRTLYRGHIKAYGIIRESSNKRKLFYVRR